MASAMDQLDPENRRRVEALLRNRPRRLAQLNSHAHRQMWPQTFAQLPGVMATMADEIAERIGDDHPHVRWLRGE
ncbi:MAG: hypothetical protein KBF28_05325 [Gemmatimonadales bacterium]|nr:hypothetical protein [Gemmatimonadales bacterium]